MEGLLPKLEHIRQARVRVGLTQRQLASLAGVSASMINQIETGRCKPGYEVARRIFEALSRSKEESSPKAGEICGKNLVHSNPEDSALEAAELMRRRGFSQLPVFDGSSPVGLVTEDGIIQIMLDNGPSDVGRLKLKDVMEPCPPIVDETTPAKTLIPLVRFSRSVLVASRGKVIGIVTASDLLGLVE